MYEAVRDLTGEAREDFLTEAQGEVETHGVGWEPDLPGVTPGSSEAGKVNSWLA